MNAKFFIVGAVCTLLSCKSKSAPVVDAGPPVSADERAATLCQRLVTAGVAKNCKVPVGEGGTVVATFDIVGGFSDDEGRAEYTINADDFKDPSGKISDGPCVSRGQSYCPPLDSYPELDASSASTQLSVMWVPRPNANIKVFPESPWGKCRAIAGPDAQLHGSLDAGGGWTATRTVADCAKRFPKEYAAYRALYEASKVAVATR